MVHRRRCREYTKLYTEKLLAGKSPSADLKAKLDVRREVVHVYTVLLQKLINCTLAGSGGSIRRYKHHHL